MKLNVSTLFFSFKKKKKKKKKHVKWLKKTPSPPTENDLNTLYKRGH